MTTIPTNAFKNILDFCGESYETKRDRLWKDIVPYANSDPSDGGYEDTDEPRYFWGKKITTWTYVNKPLGERDNLGIPVISKHYLDQALHGGSLCGRVFRLWINNDCITLEAGTHGRWRKAELAEIDIKLSKDGYYRWDSPMRYDGRCNKTNEFQKMSQKNIKKLFKKYKYYKNKKEELLFKNLRLADDNISGLSYSCMVLAANNQ
jgi:hypothetical protein